MKSATITPGTWHHRLATKYGPMQESDIRRYGTDLCTYTWAIVKGMLFVLLLIAVLGLFAGGVGDVLAWLVAGILHGFVQVSEYGAFLLSITTALVIVIGVLWGWTELEMARRSRKERLIKEKWARIDAGLPVEEEQVSFIRQAYHSFKNKYCLMLTVHSADE